MSPARPLRPVVAATVCVASGTPLTARASCPVSALASTVRRYQVSCASGSG